MELDRLLAEAAGEEVETVETPEVVEPTEVVEDNKVETKEEEVKAPEVKEEVKKTNPMKEVRDRLNSEQKAKERIEKTIQRFTEGDYKFRIRDFKTEDGKVDYEALSKAMDDADIKVKADERGISPEVQAEIERIEKEKIELQRERLRVSMDRAIANMQTTMGLKNEDINNFFKDSMAMKKNPYNWLAQGGTLQDLYYLVYRESLMKAEIKKAVDEAKAQWESNSSKKPPVTNPAKQSNDLRSSELSLNDLLSLAIK